MKSDFSVCDFSYSAESLVFLQKCLDIEMQANPSLNSDVDPLDCHG